VRIRVLLADDHAVVLHGLEKILDRPGFEVVGAVSDGRALVAAAASLKPDLIVADISMPLLNGIEALRQIRRQNPGAKVIFLSMHPEAIYAVEAIKAGASGYVVKSSDDRELIVAIKRVLAGEIYVPPSLEELVMNRLHAPKLSSREAVDALTGRQREVLQLLSEGRPPKEIGAVLGISVKTVEFHKRRIMDTLGIRTTVGLAAWAAKSGVV
jgi:DNA-binding NarL/FixJ family response regulator